MGDLVICNPTQVLNSSGDPVSGAQLFFYLAGTTTPATVYTDSAESTAHDTPVLASAAGVIPPIYRSGVALKVVIKDADGVTVYTIDPVFTAAIGGSAASQISFSATGDIAANNVQTAIETVQANLVAPLLDGGIGVTGDAVDIGSLDATNKASGMYRFTATTTGTRPSGVSGSDTGTVWLFRENSQNAVMYLVKRAGTVLYSRALSASTWGSWKDLGDATKLNGAVAQTSATDTTAGSLLTVGAFGIGGDSVLVADLTADLQTGHYRFVENTATGSPGTGAYTCGASVTRTSGGTQFIAHRQNATAANLKIWLGSRAATSGAITWVEIKHLANLLGTVSQVSSVPTGAVIERGSNGNGEYVRFADGTQICTKRLTLNYSSATAMSSGASTFSASFLAGTVPVFLGAVDATIWSNVPGSLQRGDGALMQGNSTNTYGTLQWWARSGATALVSGNYIEAEAVAIGRWY